MLHQQLSNAWRFHERAFPISPVLTLKPEGLVLGAGTVLLPAEESRRLKSVNGDDAGRENIKIEVLPWPGSKR